METPEQARERIASGVRAFRRWMGQCQPRSCRLVHYTGPEQAAVDVPLDQAAMRIELLLADGFFVGWSDQAGRAFIKVWEHGADEPPWESVFREMDLPNSEREGDQR